MLDLALLIPWWAAVPALLSIIFCFGSLIAFYYWHDILNFSDCCRNVPDAKLIPICTYWQLLTSAYNKKYPRAIILQLMTAYPRIYDRERIFVFWLAFRPLVYFYKPEMIEVLLNNSTTITKSVEYNFLKDWLGTGLLTSTGDKWRSHRKLLTPAFHFQILQNFISTFNEQSSILAEKLESAVGEPWIDIVQPITMCTLDTISQTAMGVDLKSQSGCCKEYVEGINDVSDVVVYRIVRPWLWFDPIFLYLSSAGWRFQRNLKRIQDFTRKVIKQKKYDMIQQNNVQKNEEIDKPKKKAFLELLLEHHLKDDTFTEEHIREEVDTFMFEGHDTTAMSLCWTLYEIGRNPEIQEKLLLELNSIFGNDKDRSVTSDDLTHMKYMECTIKESLRVYPSVPFIGRQLKDDLKINDYILKPGVTCLICIRALHMDPEQFPQPEIFNPDRFLPENSKRHPYSYIPFSAGPRNCIGQKFALMEQKIVLAHILRKFKVTSLDPRDKMELMMGIILKNAEPIRINFEQRIIDVSS